MSNFAHLHCHTQYSLLDGAADISSMYKKAAADGMKAVAITDHGNMFGVFQFVAEAAKHKTPNGEDVKPIVGCELYVVENRFKNKFVGGERDKRYHQLLLAKNAKGYQNLVKLCSLGYIEGLYGKYPRVDKELIVQYNEGLIATTCCIGASVPQAILRHGEEEAEKEFKWWLDLFTRENGEVDYYVELQRHEMAEQDKVNEVLLKFAKKYNVKIIASNDSHYVDQNDWNAHDILLCINTGEKQATEKMRDGGDDDVTQKGKRFAFPNDQFYFKTTAEMSRIFSDLPEAIDNTQEIVAKVEPLKLKKDILLPHFQIPEGFATQDDYLHHLTYTGAKERYKEITQEIEERLNFELHTIKTMGFAGYFLIVSDFIRAGRDIGVFIGPGRGSAAGSAVAYCIGITNIDPIKYNLLFERFLNPDRKSMPDIDTDFDDEGRQKVIDYVVEKYGKNQVAQIITYGTMAAKMSVKDVARVMDLPLSEANALAKLVPDAPGTKLKRVLEAPIDGVGSLKEKEKYQAEDLENIKQLRSIAAGNDLKAAVLKEAIILEGSVRNTGVHAAGVIIAPQDLTTILPVAKAKDSDWLVTQFEGTVIEDAGVIKMDFLGLKTLTIIRDALRLIKQHHGVEIDIDTIPLDDDKTYQLYQRGETNGTFQFESAGMQKYLKELKPDKFADLIAMNALYRPGPMEYIPNFIKRKHGLEPVTYDLDDMKEYLEDTYGITVYQEQVMLLSQKLAGFSKGDADVLRKAMGKKDRQTLDKLKPQFIDGASAKGHDTKILEKIWTDWEAFASYAFNKSHSTCYAFVAYQTAYLKAHYPSEYMAAVLSNNQGNMDKITFFMEEARRMGILVLGADINESDIRFSVNKKGQIRYALSAIKGVGEAAVTDLIEERNKNGIFTSVFDFSKRVNLRTVNKKSLENLAVAGAFDSFPYSRATYLTPDPRDNMNLIDKMIKYGNAEQQAKNVNQQSLFGGGGDTNTGMNEPAVSNLEEWGLIEKLKKEKDVVGIYITGHPLDDYKLDIQTFTNCTLLNLKTIVDDLSIKGANVQNKIPAEKEENEEQSLLPTWYLENPKSVLGKDLRVAGIVSATRAGVTKTGKSYGIFTLEDFDGSHEFALFGKDYTDFRNYMETVGAMLFVYGRFQTRWKQEDNFEFKISKIDFLSDVRNNLSKGVMLLMEETVLTTRVAEELPKILAKYPGKKMVKLNIRNHKENISFSVFSRKYPVALTNELLAELNAFDNVDVKLY